MRLAVIYIIYILHACMHVHTARTRISSICICMKRLCRNQPTSTNLYIISIQHDCTIYCYICDSILLCNHLAETLPRPASGGGKKSKHKMPSNAHTLHLDWNVPPKDISGGADSPRALDTRLWKATSDGTFPKTLRSNLQSKLHTTSPSSCLWGQS